MKVEKIKLSEIVNEKLANDELKLLIGGNMAPSCDNNVCGGGITVASNAQACVASGSGVCSGNQGRWENINLQLQLCE